MSLLESIFKARMLARQTVQLHSVPNIRRDGILPDLDGNGSALRLGIMGPYCCRQRAGWEPGGGASSNSR